MNDGGNHEFVSWTCSECTFLNRSSSKRRNLKCSMCYTTRQLPLNSVNDKNAVSAGASNLNKYKAKQVGGTGANRNRSGNNGESNNDNVSIQNIQRRQGPLHLNDSHNSMNADNGIDLSTTLADPESRKERIPKQIVKYKNPYARKAGVLIKNPYATNNNTKASSSRYKEDRNLNPYHNHGRLASSKDNHGDTLEKSLKKYNMNMEKDRETVLILSDESMIKNNDDNNSNIISSNAKKGVLNEKTSINRNSEGSTTTSLTLQPSNNSNKDNVSSRAGRISSQTTASFRLNKLNSRSVNGVQNPFAYTKQQVESARATQDRIKFISGPISIDTTTSKDWIYPTNYPIRDYQLDISRRALFENTLVSLPTGLGKTLIAAVVMYNFYRWFPDGKVVFCAPTRPLVSQQIEACYNIMGIPIRDTAEISGKINSEDRNELWNNHRMFFCTPQTLDNDIERGICDASRIVCIVLDETHKAKGEYAYVKVIERIEKSGARFRILGLSATPGTSIASVQEVIDNLRIGEVCVRVETDEDVKKYIHEKQTEVIVVKQSSAINVIDRLMINLIQPLIDKLRSVNALNCHGTAATLHPYAIFNARKWYHESRSDRIMDGVFHAAHTLLSVKNKLRLVRV